MSSIKRAMTASGDKKTGKQAALRKNQRPGHGKPSSRKFKGYSPAASEIFRSIFEESPIGIKLYDSSGMLVEANRACLEIFGVRDVEAVRGFGLFEDPTIEEEVKDKLRRGDSASYDTAFDFDKVRKRRLYETSKSGVAFMVVQITPLRSKSGVSGYIMRVQDITQRKLAEEELKKNRDVLEARVAERTRELVSINAELQRELRERSLAEEALKESEEKFRLLFDGAAEGLLLADPETRKFHSGNKTICKMLGYGPAELPGIGVENIHPAEEVTRHVENFAMMAREKETLARNVPVKRRDGSVFYADITASRVTLAGKPFLLGSFRDVTERRRKETEYRSIIEAANDAFWLVGDGGVILDVNEAACRMLGYSREELTCMHVGDIEAVETPEETARHIRKAIEQGGDRFETRQRKKDGGIIDVEVSTSFDRHSGQFFSFIREISERKQMEEALKDSEARWRSLVECAPDIILTLNEKGAIQYINAPPRGLTTEQVVGTDVCNYVPEEFRETVRKAISTVFLTGEPSSYEIAARGPHGALSWYTSRIGPIKKDGRVLSAVLITRDITGRKRVEEERRRSESHLRTLIQSIPDMVFFKDAQGRHLLVNRACEEFLGMGQEDVMGKTVEELMPAYIAEACRRSDEEALRTPWPVIVEEEAGEGPFKVHLETVKSSIRDESGNITGLVVVSRDITERKKADETLRLFSVALDEAPDGIQIVDTEGRILYSNKTMERLFGYTHEELKGKHVSFLNVDEEFAGKYIFPSIKESGQWAGELMVRHRGGREFPIWLSASMVKDSKGGPLAMVGVSRDVTQRKRMEEELRVKDKAIGAAVSGIVFCDTEGMMTYANDSFLRMWGYNNAEEVLGRPAFEVVTEPEEALRIFEELRETGIWTGELNARKKDGSDFHVHISASLVTNEAGEPLCMMGSFVDITEQKLLEEKLREASITDELTGLLNRRGFMALAEQQFKMTEREQGLLFLLFADFDNLKTINDASGHKTGDKALRETADLLRKTFRESDIIGRVGGDEFALLLTGDSGVDDEAAITARFEENIRAFNVEGGREYSLAISAGIVRFDSGCMRTFGDLLSRADTLMYENKKKKKRH